MARVEFRGDPLRGCGTDWEVIEFRDHSSQAKGSCLRVFVPFVSADERYPRSEAVTEGERPLDVINNKD